MGPSDTERPIIGHTTFKGQPVAIVGRGLILGKEYYDIRLSDGTIRTVPADACSAEIKNAENKH